jgi:O-antigen/teichoic acid export membrane protein
MGNDEDHDLKRGVWVNALGTLLKSSKAAFLVILPRLFGAQVFGLYLLTIAISEAVGKLSGAGFEWGALRLVVQLQNNHPELNVRSVLYRLCTRVLLISCVVAALIASLSVPLATRIFDKPELASPFALSCIALPILNLQFVILFVLRTSRKMQYEMYVKSVIEPITLVIAGVVAYFGMKSIQGIIWAYIFSSFVGLAASFYFFIRIFPHRKERAPAIEWGPLLQYNLSMSGMDMLNTLKAKLDVFMIGRFLPLQLVGVYGAVIELGNLLKKVRISFDPIFMPIIAHLHEAQERKRLIRQFALTLRWTLLAAIPLFLPMTICPEYLLMIFGNSFSVGANALRIVALGMMVYITIGHAENVLSMTGFPFLNFLNSLGMVILNFVLNLLLIPQYGMVGAAWASTTSLAVIALVRVIQVERLLGIDTISLIPHRRLRSLWRR